MLSPEREGRLTASDHAAALGLNPYQSRQELWRRGNGLADPPDERTKELWAWGHLHAPDAIGFYEAEVGEIVTHCLDREVFVPYDEWSGCTPDGLVGDDGLLETKCPQKLWDVPPDYYYVQCQSQLAITNRQWCALTAWTPEGSAIWTTQRDEKYWGWAVPILKSAWTQLSTGLEPKRSKKPSLPTVPAWERIA